jgi:hypothetical protein
MGSKSRYIIFMMFVICTTLNGQEPLDFSKVDSLTFNYYKSGEWDKLINFSNEALRQGIDYKYLRQRMGYAYFNEHRYFDSRYNFIKALSYDSYDQFSLEFLYYSDIYTGKEEYFGSYASRLKPETRKSLPKSFKPVESIDFEYDFKDVDSKLRSNAQYYRVGITTKITDRLRLYQAFSSYKQDIFFAFSSDSTVKSRSKQPEYYALLKWNVLDRFIVKAAYHYLHSTAVPANSGNFEFLALATDLNRFTVEAYGSRLTLEQVLTYQAGVKAGYTFPGKSDFYLRGTVSGVFQKSAKNLVYEQKAGLKVFKNVWFEGNITTGRMTDFYDYDGLYIYNAYDPLIFRGGTTIFFIAGKNISFWTNFSFEQKEYFADNTAKYHQLSFLGGIKWTL